MKKSYKYLIIINILLLTLLGIIETKIQIKPEEVFYSENPVLNFGHFKAFSNNSSEADFNLVYDLRMTYHNNSLDSVYVEAVIYPHFSWIKWMVVDKEYLLSHIQYRYNIIEVVARQLRKTFSELPLDDVQKQLLYNHHVNARSEVRYQLSKYNMETGTGWDFERQKDWEYIVDSLLNEYATYSDPLILFKREPAAPNMFFKEIQIDSYNNIKGIRPISPELAMSMKRYCFFYEERKVLRIEYRDRDSLATDELYGAAIIVIERNIENEVWRFYDTEGLPMLNNDGVHAILIDRAEETLSRVYLDLSDIPVEDIYGVCKVEWLLDNTGRRVMGRFYNKNGSPVASKEGYFSIKFLHDSGDNVTEMAFFDMNGNLKELEDGIAIVRYQHDKRGNISTYSTYNSLDKLHPHKDKIAIAIWNYDLNGNIIRESFLKPDSSVWLDEYGVAIKYFAFDAYGNITDHRNFGLNRNLIFDGERNGRIVRRYDANGNVIEHKNFDAYGYLMNNINNQCKGVFAYDSEKRMISEEVYQADSISWPVFIKKIHYAYDISGNVIELKFTNKKDRLLPDSTGVCIIKKEYCLNANLSMVSHFNKKGELINPIDASAIIRYKYDENDNMIEIALYDENDQPTGLASGIAKESYKYDGHGRLIENCFFDEEDNLVHNQNGIKVMRFEYDDRGNIIKESYYDENDKLVPGSNGIASYVRKYNEVNNLLNVVFLGANGQPFSMSRFGVTSINYHYDGDNRVSQISFHDINGNLRHVNEGYAVERILYGTNGYIIRREFFCDKFLPVVNAFGYAAVDILYDWNGNDIANIIRDELNQLIEDANGNAIFNWVHNRNGIVIAENTFSADSGNLSEIDPGPFNVFIKYGKGQNANHRIYSSNEPVRTQKTYYNNGNIETEVTYVDGWPEGVFTSWYETGEVESKIEYENGVRHGRTIEYYKNGNVRRELEYRNGMLVSN